MAKKGIIKGLVSKALNKALSAAQFALSTAETFVGLLKESMDAEATREQVEIEFAAQAKSWQQFYREIFGLEVDFSGMKAPDYDYNDYLVFVSKKLDIPWIIESFKYHFADIHVDEEVGDLKKLQSIERTFDGDYYVKIVTDLSLISLNEFEDDTVTLEERLLLDMHSRWAKKEPLLCDGSATFCNATVAVDGRVVEVISDMDGLGIVLEAPIIDYSVDPV